MGAEVVQPIVNATEVVTPRLVQGEGMVGVATNFKSTVDQAQTPEKVAGGVDSMALGEPVVDTRTQGGETSATQTKDASPQKTEKVGENNKTVKERVIENRNRRLGEAVQETDKQLGIQPEEKDASGLPTDESKRTEYVRALAANSEKAGNQAVEDTIRQQYEEDFPPPVDGDRAKLAEWAIGYQDYQKAMHEAQQEAGEAAKKAESEAGQKKKQEKNESEDSKEKEEDTSTSMGNAFRLVSELNSAENDSARKKVEDKIQQIHNNNPDVRPPFKTRVKIAQAVQISMAALFMVGVGVASENVTKAASSVK